jgi:hypothetical protein
MTTEKKKKKKETDSLACHHFFNLYYALIDRWIDRLSVCPMSNIEEDRIAFCYVLSVFVFFSSDMSPNSQLEHEKRVRREIANSNERRRMQSINTGFQSLKILIPHSCGEKLSKVCINDFIFKRLIICCFFVYFKACILQRAADHIKTLENEKLKLQSQNEQFRILIKSFQIDSTSVLQGQRHLSTNGKYFFLSF